MPKMNKTVFTGNRMLNSFSLKYLFKKSNIFSEKKPEKSFLCHDHFWKKGNIQGQNWTSFCYMKLCVKYFFIKLFFVKNGLGKYLLEKCSEMCAVKKLRRNSKKSFIYKGFPKKLGNNIPEISRKFFKHFEIIL